jgi:hypothetical protein
MHLVCQIGAPHRSPTKVTPAPLDSVLAQAGAGSGNLPKSAANSRLIHFLGSRRPTRGKIADRRPSLSTTSTRKTGKPVAGKAPGKRAYIFSKQNIF